MKKRKKFVKGTYGYVSHEKIRRLLVTLVLFAIPLAIFVTGYIQTKTNMNLFTVVALVGCLPACKSLVGLIMILMQKQIPSDRYEQIKKASGTLVAGYDLIFTAYEHTIKAEAVAVCGNQIVCYTPDEKADAAFLEKHIGKIMTVDGYHNVQVKVMKDLKQYLLRVATLDEKQDQYREGISFTPDERYPMLSREELIYHTLLAIAL